MNKLECTLKSHQRQEPALTHLPNKQWVGIEVVRSADVSRNHYFGPRPGRRSAPTEAELSKHDCIAILRAQLRLLRLRAETGAFISPDSIAHAERLASTLEVAA
jgi:hypothetical protein